MSFTDQVTVKNINQNDNLSQPNSKCPLSIGQILAITIPLSAAILFTAIFVPIYVIKNKDDKTKYIIISDNSTTLKSDIISDIKTDIGSDINSDDIEFDEFNENITNVIYATLTPKDGYDKIFIFLQGISELSTDHFDFFKSNNTFIPKGTKIYSISGTPRQMQYMIDYYNYTNPVPAWFNVYSNGTLCPPENFTQANASLNYILDEIDRIKNNEKNIDYKDIYLAGFSQGAIMVNYVLLNSRHELGGYLPFSGYILDHEFPESTVVPDKNRTPKQNEKLESKKNYHVLASHSFNDNRVFYELATYSYSEYFRGYTNALLISFGEAKHIFPYEPSLPIVRNWLKERMGKLFFTNYFNHFNMTTTYMYGIIGAMDREIETLVNDLENKKEEKKFGLTFYLGKLKKYEVVIVKCGVGKVNAGRTAQVLISEYGPKFIINTGIGGGLNEQLNIGDIVISTDLIQHDFDVTFFGYAKGNMYDGGNNTEPTKYIADKDLSEKIKKSLEKVRGDRNIFFGRVLTGDMFIHSTEKREELVKEFDGFCCEMEGAAIGQVSTLNNIPFTVIRVISDLPTGEGPENYNNFEAEAAKLSSMALETFLEE